MVMTKSIPINIVGSTRFGRYPKISIENTYNMIISDGFLVNYAGFEKKVDITDAYKGRGLFKSTRNDKLYGVIGDGLYEFYTIGDTVYSTLINTLDTSEGDVYIAENNANQLAISDLNKIYIYNYVTGDFTTPALDFTPGYISFQNTRFIAAATYTNDPSNWRLSDNNDGNTWTNDAAHTGEFQTKPDTVVGVQPFPGRGNLIFIFGETVTEAWQDVGANLFPYQRNSSFNIDYGCINPATIAYNDNIIVWIGANEKSGPVVMYSNGGEIKSISTDGIDFLFGQLTNPTNAYGFLFRQDGHTLYQFNFPDDNLSYVYDFNTHRFFTVTDYLMGSHPARRVAFYNNKYFFVGFNDGHLYEMDSEITTYDGEIIPRIRVTNNIRLPNTMPFIANRINVTMEEGINTDPDVDGKIFLSVSKDGGQSFSAEVSKTYNQEGNFLNIVQFWNLGRFNDFVAQFRFMTEDRVVVGTGVLEAYQ